MNPIEKRNFLFRYILTTPVSGNLLNYAWNNLTELGKDFKQREEILKTLKNRSPLPGNLFSLRDKIRRETILKHLAKNFPEYIDLYSQTCLKFLKGDGDFPNGNPTAECDDLFQDNETVIQPHLVKNYKEIKFRRF